MMKKIVFISSLIFFFCFTCFADFSVSRWKFKEELFIKDGVGDIVELQIDTEILSNSKPDLADLRIISEDNKEIPYLVSLKKEIRKTVEYHPVMLNKSFIPDSHTLVEFDMGNQRVLHNCLVLNISASNYTRWVEVKGKNNGKWYTLTRSGFIFSHSIPEAGVSVSSTRIPYPLTDYRYIRVIIHGGALDVQGATLLREDLIPAQEIKYPISVKEMGKSKDGKFMEYLIDTSVSGLPHYRLEIQTNQKNFHRRVIVSPYQDISESSQNQIQYKGTIYSFHTKEYSESNKSIVYPENNARYLRVFLYHYDDQPLAVENFNLYGIVRKISFPFSALENKQRIFLYYGNKDANVPVYDFEKYQSYLKPPNIIMCVSGNQENNPLFKASPFEKFDKNKRLLLGIIMAFAAIILGFFIIKNMRGIIKGTDKNQ
jgi:hypothetical protein